MNRLEVSGQPFEDVRIDVELTFGPEAIFEGGAEGVESSVLLGLQQRLLDIGRLFDDIIRVWEHHATRRYTPASSSRSGPVC